LILASWRHRVLAIVVVLTISGACRDGESEYRRIESPDGRFRILVLATSGVARPPGQGGDAPGIVRLVDREGHVLAEKQIEMVQLVDEVRWTEKRVEIKLVADWDLPPP
jgi:hypothetical protein